uniref:von Willebrand factor type A n=1 Tax=Geobacter sp. (strain M21) TaxID=443144 RepID=C6DZT8_GEOSM
MRFHDPQMLFLLALLVPLFVWIRRGESRRPALPLSAAFAGNPLPDTLRSRLARLLPYLRLAVLALGIAALARPQAVERESRVRSRGMDLVLALDLSTSMLAEEQGREGRGESRLAAAKRVLAGFIGGRKDDRIGLVAFAGRPYPAAPLTSDHQWLQGVVDRLDTGAVEDGTALGDAILSGVNRLRRRPAESRALILITDGRNNAGAEPQLAAQAAKALGIRVHAIGIGSRGSAVIPVPSPLGGTIYRRLDAELDAATLKGVAELTGGRYFEAGDATVLSRVFAEIDRLERTPIEEKVFFSYAELYRPLIAAALLLFLAEMLLRGGWLRRSC